MTETPMRYNERARLSLSLGPSLLCSMKNQIKRIIRDGTGAILISFLFCIQTALFASDPDPIKNKQPISAEPAISAIDLINATLNGRPLRDLTLDKITDLLGRPSAVTDPRANKDGNKISYYGACLYYHEKGVYFAFFHPQQDKDQHLEELHVYLAKKMDERFTAQFIPYKGKLSRDVNGDWKVKKILEIFSDLKPEDLWANAALKREKYRAEVEKAKALDAKFAVKLRSTYDTIENSDLCVLARLRSHSLRFDYEKNTQFIERITLLNLRQH